MRKRIKFKFELDGHCTETDTAYDVRQINPKCCPD